ncbi:MAG: efflux RND transporter permease subunit [Planctomycetes bacterium]|nr:efflux RND transporter permease subunit [Planctomycetota bacterium]
MLNRWIAFCLRNRHLVAAAAIAVAIYGTVVALRMPVDVLPDLDRPTVTILTEVHGMASADVERRITIPLERNLNGAAGVTRVRSLSGRGFSILFVEFAWDTDVRRNRALVQERLDSASGTLPRNVRPEMRPVASIMGQVHFIGVESLSGGTDPNALREVSDRLILPRIRALEGVAQVLSIGGASRELQVIVEAAKLRANDVALGDVIAAVQAADLGGAADAPAAESALSGLRPDPGRTLCVSDLASVELGPPIARLGEAGVNGRPGVVLIVFKEPAVDTLELTRRVEAEIAAIRTGVPEDVRIVPDLFRQAVFIERSMTNVELALRDGVILVLVVLFVFLANFRTTFITLTAIPLSVAVTAAVFHALGLTINTMTLGGLAVAVGALVDDAVVDVENVFRRLRLESGTGGPAPALWTVFRASCEVRNPILIGTLLVVVVYVPLFFLSGMEGRLFTPIGLAYIVSTLASLVVSLTVTPTLCYYLLGSRFVSRHRADSWFVRQLKHVSGAAIRLSLRHPFPIAATLLSLVAASAVTLATRGTQFLPAFNEGAAQINLILPPDASLEVSDAYGRRLEGIAAGVPGVKSVGRRTGRAEGDEHVDGSNVTEAVVTFDPASGRRREEIIEDLRKRLAEGLPGPAVSVEQPLAHLLSHLLSGVNAQVAIKIYGPDLDVLRRSAAETEAAIRNVPGVRDLFVEPQVLVDQPEIVPDPARCADAGLLPEDVAEAADAALAGEELGRARLGQEEFPVVVRLREEDRRDLETIRNLPLRAGDGEWLRIRDVADVRMKKSPNTILHENGSRRIVVQHNVAGRPLGDVVADVEKALAPVRANLAKTPGYELRLSGQFEAQQAATRRIGFFSVAAFLAMALILFAHFRSANLTFQVLLSVPAAFVGAVAWIVASDQTLSVATLVGLISLGGIAARNAILLLDHYLHLLRHEGAPFGPETIIRAGQERMVPVLMTALCSGIALVPLALAPDQPGREILFPVATVILGGLVTVTLAEFLVTPGVFHVFGRAAALRAAARHGEPDDDIEKFRMRLLGHQPPGDMIQVKGTSDA